MTAQYRYVFADLLTDVPIAVLELEQVRFDRRIIQAGTFTATCPVPNSSVARQVRKIVPQLPEEIHTGPGRTVVHVYRDGQLWGTYIIWQATPSSDEQGKTIVQLQGASLESYLNRVMLSENHQFADVEQTVIGAELLVDMQLDPAANIGLVLSPTDTAVIRNRVYLISEGATYGQRLAELANVDEGFEWMIRCYVDPATGLRVREWVAARQLSANSTDHYVAKPGNVLSWSYGINASTAATSYRTRGATINDDLGETSEPLLSAVHDSAPLLAAGWPRLDTLVDYQSVSVLGTLNDYAHWWRDNRAGAVRILQVTIRLDEHTRFTPNALGDYARVVITDPWFPLEDGRPSFSRRPRIVGCEITPPTKTDGQERCALIFEEVDD